MLHSGHAAPITQSKPFREIQAAFPHIARSIALFWGHTELVPYLRTLQGTADDRYKSLVYPLDILSAFGYLEALHSQLFPHLTPNERDYWDTY